jgi:hypothetical protein
MHCVLFSKRPSIRHLFLNFVISCRCNTAFSKDWSHAIRTSTLLAFMTTLKKVSQRLSRDNWWSGRDLNWMPPEYKSRAIPNCSANVCRLSVFRLVMFSPFVMKNVFRPTLICRCHPNPKLRNYKSGIRKN